MKRNLEKSEAKVAEQQAIINYQRNEIVELEKTIKNQTEQLKKIEESAAKARNPIDQVNLLSAFKQEIIQFFKRWTNGIFD